MRADLLSSQSCLQSWNAPWSTGGSQRHVFILHGFSSMEGQQKYTKNTGTTMILLNLSSAESTILESGKQATWELRLPSRLFTSLSPPPTVDDQVVAFPVPGVSHVECHPWGKTRLGSLNVYRNSVNSHIATMYIVCIYSYIGLEHYECSIMDDRSWWSQSIVTTVTHSTQ